MKKYLGTVSIIVALLGYVVIITGLLSSNMRANFTTFALYTILASVSLVNLIVQKGNYKIMIGFVAGNAITMVLLLYKGRFAWTTLDSVVSALILACLLAWKIKGAKAALFAITASTCVAAIPAAVEMWHHPQASAAPPWIIWSLANIISFIARKSWKLEEWLLQAMTATVNGVIAILSFL
jgi:hypothetical protein